MKRGYVYIILTALAFSTMEVVGKTIANQLNPLQLNFLRFLIGGIILLPFAIKELRARKVSLTVNDFLFFALTGFLGIAFSMSLFQMAVVYAKASEVAVIVSTNPIFTVPFAYLILKEKLPANALLALALCLVGLGFFLNPLGGIHSDLTGIWLAILSALTFSLYGVISRIRVEKYGSFALNSLTFLVACAMLFVYLTVRHIPTFTGITASNIIQVAYMGIVVTGLGYLFYFLAMKETSAVTASTVFFIKPALAPILSLIFLHEVMKVNTVIGVLCVLAGSFVMLRGKSQAARALKA